MNILLTNDDGLRAPGIAAMYEALIDTQRDCNGPLTALPPHSPGSIEVIAPLTVQSATSHGVTFHEPLITRREKLGWGNLPTMSGIAVDGRPADCVKLALSNLWPEIHSPGSKPDLVISGMNAGANVGINVIYSGTVAAALEAAFLGIPSIAVSLHIGSSTPDFHAAAQQARRAINRILSHGLPDPHTCLSINVPITESSGHYAPPAAGYPIRVCPMNTHGLNDQYERRVSPEGQIYYWSKIQGLNFRSTTPESDVDLLAQRYITVTPLRYDLTKKSVLEKWKKSLG